MFAKIKKASTLLVEREHSVFFSNAISENENFALELNSFKGINHKVFVVKLNVQDNSFNSAQISKPISSIT